MTSDGYQPRDRKRLGWFLAAIGMLSVSTDSLWVRLSKADAVDVAFLVASCALPLYAVLGRWLEHTPPLESLRRHTKPLLAVGALSAVSQLSFFVAVTQTRVANAVAIVAAAPLVAAALARMALGERITMRMGVAVLMTIAGIAAIVSSSVGEPTLDGDLLAVVAVCSFTGATVVWRKHTDMSRFAGLSISAVIVITCTSFVASPLSLDGRAYLVIAVMGLCFNPLGRLAYSTAPRFAPVSEVALFSPLETVAGTLWAALFLGELPRAVAVVGSIVVLLGVFYGTVASLHRTDANTGTPDTGTPEKT